MQIEDLTTAVAAQGSATENWRQAYSLLMSTPVDQVWRAAKPAEQRKVLADVFERMEPDQTGMRFRVRGLEPVLEIDWQRDDVCYLKVAGPGIEPGTP